MDFCINGEQLRKALKDIEAAEANGFLHCLAVFRMTSAGFGLGDCRASYSDLIERGSDSPAHNWGRFQGVTRRHRFKDGELIPLSAPVLPGATKATSV